mmetsp:Transcript_340/g.907  ORF Transcript_340/g.907 Transcript_340/m.907 type:complete len:485 (-) Transcript_340:346-1800(-)
MREAHHGGLGHCVVLDQRRLDLGGAQPVSRHVDHIVHSAGDPVVPIGIPLGTVAGEVEPGKVSVVHLLEAGMIAVDRARHPRWDLLEAQITRLVVTLENGTVGVHQHRLDPEEGPHGGTGLGVGVGRQRRHAHPSGLRLPPRVDDRAVALAHHLVIPLPRFRVDGLADGPQNPERRSIVLGDVVVARLDEQPDCGRCGIKLVDLEPLHHLPVSPSVGVGRDGLEQHRLRSVQQWSIRDIRVTGDPPSVSNAGVDIAVLVVKDVLVRHRGVRAIPPGGVHQPLGRPGRPRGVEDEERVLSVHGLGRTHRPLRRHRLLEHNVIRSHQHLGPGPRLHKHRLDPRALGDRGVNRLLQWNVLPATHALVGRQHHLGSARLDPRPERLGREARKDNRVHRANPGARQHRVHNVRRHRHVDAYCVALADPAGFERVREAAHLVVQLLVRHRVPVGRFVGFEDECGGVWLGRHVAVNAVLRRVQLPPGEPLD